MDFFEPLANPGAAVPNRRTATNRSTPIDLKQCLIMQICLWDYDSSPQARDTLSAFDLHRVAEDHVLFPQNRSDGIYDERRLDPLKEQLVKSFLRWGPNQ